MKFILARSLIVYLGYVGTLILGHNAQSLHCARNLSRLADTIHKTNGNHSHKQQALAQAFKNSISHSKTEFKPVVLHKIITAVAHKTRFNDLIVKKTSLENAIDQFHATPGFLNVLQRLVTGITNNNSANVNGAIAEVNAALEKTKQQKVIMCFGKIIKNREGKTITEIDLISQDLHGSVEWAEIKTRNKLRDDDPLRINTQNSKQREIARQAGAKYTLTIRITHPRE